MYLIVEGAKVAKCDSYRGRKKYNFVVMHFGVISNRMLSLIYDHLQLRLSTDEIGEVIKKLSN